MDQDKYVKEYEQMSENQILSEGSRDVHEFKNMGGGLSDAYVSSNIGGKNEIEATFGTYASSNKRKWTKKYSDFGKPPEDPEQKYEWKWRLHESEKAKIEKALKPLLAKLDKEVASAMKKLGYK